MTLNSFIRKDLHAHVYADAVVKNVHALRSLCRKETKFCAVIKANAYGHGSENIVNILKNQPVDYFAVVSIYEAIRIHPLVRQQNILVLEPVYDGQDPNIIRWCAENNIECTVSSLAGLKYIEQTLAATSHTLPVHFNLQTGMGRCGVDFSQADQMIQAMDTFSHIRLAGIYTHFATADEQDLTYANEQLSKFKMWIDKIPQPIRKNLLIHAANSPATIQMPQSHFDMVRCGISLYGYTTIETPLPIQLHPALKLEAPIIHLLKIAKGESVSYARTFYAKRDTLAAVLPLGYSDGIKRGLSQKIPFLLNGKTIPQIGRITMNQIIIDVTDIPNIACGQNVTVIDNNFDSPCGVNAWANADNTINYEILTRIPPYANYHIHQHSSE